MTGVRGPSIDLRAHTHDWPSIFPNAACTTALIDRIVHHADVIAIEGDSYRRREAASKTQARRLAKE